MVTVTLAQDSALTPRLEFIKRFEIAFAEGDFAHILDSISEDVQWRIVGFPPLQGKAAVAESLPEMMGSRATAVTITHLFGTGDSVAAAGTMSFEDGTSIEFGEFYTFGAGAGAGGVGGDGAGTDGDPHPLRISAITAFVAEA